MIDLVLNDLRGPTLKGFDAHLHFGGLILDFYFLKTLALSRATQKGQTALLGEKRLFCLQDHGIEHGHI